MFNYIAKLFQKPHGTGWLLDPPDERDWRAEEIFQAFPPVSWQEIKSENWKRFPARNQAGSSSCVGYSTALALGMENFLEEGKFVDLAPRFIYGRKYVASGGGMYYHDACNIAVNEGCPPEQLLPGEAKGETEMRKLDDEAESDRLIAKTYRAKSYIWIPVDIDAIAGIISLGKPVLLGTRFNSGGYNTGEVKLELNGQYGHAVVGTDYTLYNGKKALIFQNSWGNWGFNGLGVITEDQMKGVPVAVYFEDLANLETAPVAVKPKYTFEKDLSVGSRGTEVAKLQECLKYEGLFPISVPITGYMGGITREAVIGFQIKYGITPQLGYCGAITRQKLNELFS